MKRTIHFLFLILFTFSSVPGSGQERLSISHNLNWFETHLSYSANDETVQVPTFAEADALLENPLIPVFGGSVKISQGDQVDFIFANMVFKPVDLKNIAEASDFIPESIKVTTRIMQDRNHRFVQYSFVPIIERSPGIFEKLVSFDAEMKLSKGKQNPIQRNGPEFKIVSEFSEGSIYKIAVAESGFFKLDYSFLKDQVGINQIDDLNPNQIKIYSNGGGIVPEAVSAEQIDDIEEIGTYRKGLSDGKFQSEDYILFYAEGPNQWEYSETQKNYRYEKNPYEDFNYYFIKVSNKSAVQTQQRASHSFFDYESTTYDDLQVLNEDKINILGKYQSPGGGKQWFGDEFSNQRSKNYTDAFDFANAAENDTTWFRVGVAARSATSSSFQFEIGGASFNQIIPSVLVNKFDVDYARFRTLSDFIINQGSNPQIELSYPSNGNGSSSAWLDYIELIIRKKTIYQNTPLTITDSRSSNYNTVKYLIQNGHSGLLVWDITQPTQPVSLLFEENGGVISFGVENQFNNNRFVVFDPSSDYPKPTFIELVENQNLHAMSTPEMVILYYPEFKDAAQELATHRINHSGIETTMIDVSKVYQEFGGGAKDPTAIRDMARMFYTRSDNFKYMLLMGDATYDFRNRNTSIPYDNFITAYETNNSLHPVFSYPTDDYYALLSEDDGADIGSFGLLDICVGRLPVKTSAEASQVVNKIIRYETAPQTFGDWRNRIIFMADDGDSDLHLRQVDGIAATNDQNHPVFNQEKIYLDAYQQISTPGGERYPDVNTAIQNNIFKGALVYNYLGHGGQEGLADERVLRGKDIDDWNNPFKMPLFITATCSFTGYDEPSYYTAGEHAILNPEGGTVALMTTTRDVYSGQNELLTKAVFSKIFTKINGEYLTIGEIMRLSKNSISTSSTRIQNARKFSIIGDPAMKLAIPKYQVFTTEMNGELYAGEIIDTIRALEKVTLKGYVGNDQGEMLSSFNGKLITTVFDKEQIVKTRGNDEGSSEREFNIQNGVVFKGNATIENGQFELSFVVPKDIRFEYGQGKISYYATDESKDDAHGYFEDFIIGGAATANVNDDQGPVIDIFMDDESFVFGGTTGKNPVLLLKLSDDTGINVSGSSIGHDLEAVLDGNTKNSFILNDFYEAKVDDYTSGTVQFPFFDLEEGKHTIQITAWDIANNFAEAFSEFIVVVDAQAAIKHLFNYPNPFSDETCFQFEHNRSGSQVDVTIQIFTISGRLVKTIDASNIVSDGSQVTGIKWDGTDDFGGYLAKGIYLYRVEMRTLSGSGGEIGVSDFEKLVLLK